MTVLKSDAKSPVYVSTGEAGQAYPLGFAVIDPGHVKVAVGGSYVDRSLYTVTDSGVRFNEPVPSGQTVVIVRDTPFDQQTDIQNNTPFYAEIMETAIDKLTMMCQQLREKLSRGLVVPPDTADLDQEKLFSDFLRFTESIEDWLNHIDASLAGAEAARDAAGASERNAKASENASAASEREAKASENAANGYAGYAEQMSNSASGSARNASGSASAAKASEDAAKASETSAGNDADRALSYRMSAHDSAAHASASARDAKNSENAAGGFRDIAESMAELAGDRYNQANQARIAAEAARDGAVPAAAAAGESEKNAETWAEGGDPEVSALGGTHSSKVHSGVSEAYATAPFGQTVGESVSLAGAMLNAVVTKDTVDSAIGAGPSGSENRFYNEKGEYVPFPNGAGVNANTDLANLTPAGEQKFEDLYLSIDAAGDRKMGYGVYTQGTAVSAGVVWSVMQMDEVRVPEGVFSAPGKAVGFTFTGEGEPAHVIVPGTLENAEAAAGHFVILESGEYSVALGGAGGISRLVLVTDGLRHPVVAEVLLSGSGADTSLSNLSPEGEARFTAKADKAVAAQELAGASVVLQPGRYYTWAASGACAVSYGAWDAEKLEVSELRMSVSSGTTVSFPEGTVLKGDAIEGGKSYIVSVSHDATGYVAVVMERA